MLQEIKEFFPPNDSINSIIHANRKELSRDSKYKNNVFDYLNILSVDY